MKFLTAPDVRLLAVTQFAAWNEMPEDTIDWQADGAATDSELLIEFAGRQCYESWENKAGRTNAAYIENIKSVGHTSVLEHASASLRFAAVSRSWSHEAVRHRHLSCCLAGDTVVYQDTSSRGSGSKKKTLVDLFEMSQDRRRTYVKTMQIRTVTDQGIITHGRIRSVAYSGRQELFNVVCENGMSIRATALHRFLTPEGWSRLHELVVGNIITANGKPLYQDEEWLSERVEEGLSSKQISTLAGAQEVTIRSWRRRFGLSGPVGQGMRGRSAWNKGDHSFGRGRTLSPETRQRISDSHRRLFNPDHWANGNAVARYLYAQDRTACWVCRSEEHLEIHHRDGNPKNNEQGNIEMLCNACHKWRHKGTPPKKTYATRIVSIESVGIHDTYDIEMEPPYACFVANGLVVHNSQLSQRYVSAEEVNFIVPPAIRGNEAMEREFKTSCGAAKIGYDHLTQLLQDQYGDVPDVTLRRKLAREAARSVLPNATETRLVLTGNLTAWRWFCLRRASQEADAEMCQVACRVVEILKGVAPSVFSDFERRVSEKDGREYYHTELSH